MKKTVQLSIKKPCSQNFEDFTKTDLGGFCQGCKKEVLDFTQMTDNQLIHYFSTAKGNTCGRFKKSQLKTYQSANYGSMNNYLPKTAGIASFSLLALCAVPNLVAQDVAVAMEQVEQRTNAYLKTVVNTISEIEPYTVKGTVLDEEKQPLPGVNVVLKGTTTGTQTDFDGRFAFPKTLVAGDVLVFSYLGYETKTYRIKSGASDTKDITIQFKASDVFLMGEVVVGGVHSTKRTFFQKIGDLFR